MVGEVTDILVQSLYLPDKKSHGRDLSRVMYLSIQLIVIFYIRTFSMTHLKRERERERE